MNILPKKSWHVRNKDNIAKVRRDEENARLEEEKADKRAALADQEARTKLLRDRGRKDQNHASVEGPSSSIVLCDETQSRHFNLFEAEESSDALSKTTNQEYEAEKKEEQEKKEKALGILKYLGQSTREAETPWYLKQDKTSSEIPTSNNSTSTKDTDKKKRLDPLHNMNLFLEKTKSSEQKKEKKSKKEKQKHKERSKKRKKTIEELRAERLQREKEERFRAEKLFKETKEGNSDKKEDEDPYKGSYYSQYNPDLARKPKWNNRYEPY